MAINWQNGRAIGIIIPHSFVQSIPDDSLTQLVSIHLANQETAIAGQYIQTDTAIVFEPVIPFTRGLTYSVWLRHQRLRDISIATLPNTDRPRLLAIYPTQDSVPDNLLKIYLHFSRPMREGQSQHYVTLLKNGTDTLPNVFLDLQPELWNADRTLLTLWLDPGRIKRDVQPNKQLGTPLQANTPYQLVVAADWPDEQGASLGKTMTKNFVTVSRDSLSPTPSRWLINSPKAESNSPLRITFGEALDYSLLTETLHIIEANEKSVSGTWQLNQEEKRAEFKPNRIWKSGIYKLRIESRLEDLAGNNLNRLFDRDITQKQKAVTDQRFREVSFEIR